MRVGGQSSPWSPAHKLLLIPNTGIYRTLLPQYEQILAWFLALHCWSHLTALSSKHNYWWPLATDLSDSVRHLIMKISIMKGCLTPNIFQNDTITSTNTSVSSTAWAEPWRWLRGTGKRFRWPNLFRKQKFLMTFFSHRPYFVCLLSVSTVWNLIYNDIIIIHMIWPFSWPKTSIF